jgi:hypothetical protein
MPPQLTPRCMSLICYKLENQGCSPEFHLHGIALLDRSIKRNMKHGQIF